MIIPLLPRWIRVLLVLVIILTLFTGSVAPISEVSTGETNDNGGIPLWAFLHIIGYLTFTGALIYALADSSYSNNEIIFVVFLISVIFGMFMELIQNQINYRTFSFIDMILNSLGALVAVLFWHLFSSRIQYVQTSKTIE